MYICKLQYFNNYQSNNSRLYIRDFPSKRQTLRERRIFNIIAYCTFDHQALITIVIALKFCDNAYK